MYNIRPHPYQEQRAHTLVTLMRADIGGLLALELIRTLPLSGLTSPGK
jgi:hypothetical protein